MIDWYCLKIETGKEQRAAEKLGRAGYVTYLPRCRRASGTGAGTGPAELLFPGYLPLQDPGDAWDDVLGRRLGYLGQRIYTGVRGVLCHRRDVFDPAPLPTGFVERLRHQEGMSGVIVVRIERKPKFYKGQLVRAIDGPYIGFMGAIAFEEVRGAWAVMIKDKLVKGLEAEHLEAVA